MGMRHWGFGLSAEASDLWSDRAFSGALEYMAMDCRSSSEMANAPAEGGFATIRLELERADIRRTSVYAPRAALVRLHRGNNVGDGSHGGACNARGCDDERRSMGARERAVVGIGGASDPMDF